MNVARCVHGDQHVNLIALPERKYATWIGGSILAMLFDGEGQSRHFISEGMWLSKAEYDEHGAVAVHRRWGAGCC